MNSYRYPCPVCGHDGPHEILIDIPEMLSFECAGCTVEIDLPGIDDESGHEGADTAGPTCSLPLSDTPPRENRLGSSTLWWWE